MAADELHLTLTGGLGAAIRTAADEAGLSPQDWMTRILRTRLDARVDDWETVTEPTGTFTVALPRGWQHELATVMTQIGPGRIFNSRSPDGTTTIYGNDPHIPLRMLGERRQSGDVFGAEYLSARHGRLPGFRLTGSRPLPRLAALVDEGTKVHGGQLEWVDASEVSAEYTQDGQRITVTALAATFGVAMGWGGQVMQVVSTGDASAWVPACLRIFQSFSLTQFGRQSVLADRAMRDQAHRATMNQIDANTRAMTAGHQQRMNNIQAQGAAWQQSMQERQQVFDAGVDSWHQQQATSDASHSHSMDGLRQSSTYGADASGSSDHRNFINAMKEEETVTDRDGWQHQVEAGPDKYYYNEHREAFIGLQSHQDLHDVPGINPDDWYETPIQR